VQTEPQPQR